MRKRKTEDEQYDEIKSFLTIEKKKPLEEIRIGLQTHADELGIPLSHLIRAYVRVGSQKGDPDVKTRFKEVLGPLLPQTGKDRVFFVICYLRCNGLMDLVEFSLAEKSGDDFELLIELTKQIAWDDNLLIIGETGTSKQLAAEAIHDMSKRSGNPFQDMNCAALSESLLESELFGHEKGAFTGAEKLRKGKIEKANGGTVYLDELGKMPERLQAKLLKVIEQKKLQRVGGEVDIKLDVRFLASAQPDDIKDGKIIPDLSYRMQNRLFLPPLKERMKADAKTVITSSLRYACKSIGVPEGNYQISDDAIQVLKMWYYPGNYRELEGILKAILKDVIFWGRNRIQIVDVNDQIMRTDSSFRNYLFQQLGGDTSGEHLIPSSKKKAVSLEDVKLKDIIDYADGQASKIIERKVRSIYQKGGDLKKALIDEGVPKNKYLNYYNKLTKRIGKIRELKKAVI